MASRRVTVSIEEAQAQLRALIDQALAGDEVAIACDAQAVVRLIRAAPAAPPAPKRPLLGAMKGQFTVPDSFFEPMSEEDLSLWYDGRI